MAPAEPTADSELEVSLGAVEVVAGLEATVLVEPVDEIDVPVDDKLTGTV